MESEVEIEWQSSESIQQWAGGTFGSSSLSRALLTIIRASSHLESRKNEEEDRTILHSAMFLHKMVDIGNKNPMV